LLKLGWTPASLSAELGPEHGMQLGDLLPDTKSETPDTAAFRETLRQKIDQTLKTLTYREREIVRMRFGLGDGYTYTLEQVASVLHLTRERVRQIQTKALTKLQAPIRRRALQGYVDALSEVAPQYEDHRLPVVR
jgi:RNA polymerase primary sigma factor